MDRAPACIALIPARSGSLRVAGKNIRPLAGHPLIAYTIAAAKRSGVFRRVVVSTDSPDYADLARRYGAEVPFLRPADMAGPTSPDIEWVLHALAELGGAEDCFSILRPTSPFRTPDTIRRAWAAFLAGQPADSLRAVEPCGQHPGKMWVIEGGRMRPLLDQPPGQTPWHSSQYQSLPPVHVQNASLEIAWRRTAEAGGTIAGDVLIPFLTEGMEGFDVNTPDDWILAEHHVAADPSLAPDPSPDNDPETAGSTP